LPLKFLEIVEEISRVGVEARFGAVYPSHAQPEPLWQVSPVGMQGSPQAWELEQCLQQPEPVMPQEPTRRERRKMEMRSIIIGLDSFETIFHPHSFDLQH